jgi:hypothetical protein
VQRRTQPGVQDRRREINADSHDLREERDRREIDVFAAVPLDQVIDSQPEAVAGNQRRDEKADAIENRARPG